MRKITFILPLIFMSCVRNGIDSIVVQYNNSSEINLFKGLYIVQFMDKEDFCYNFSISENEIIEVKRIYDNQNISNYEKELLIVDDKPLIMPTSDTKYVVSLSNGNKQTFIVRTDYRNNPLDTEKYKNLKVFIEKINDIIKSKKEIKDAEKSNILYF
ncbi:hypothetical protein [Myroides sp. LoEW2-1]|uniref:hypothetical protein n=1 Tax=Myroides sp. LoEW2-1 TaxID=2683192 RepID=UPI0013236A0A|nr:hypothetical protein [Myroides sp. LoEW2-1]MVX34621.1 hypothetical protein [Myroides sp. LoEW2-1]